jgi:hypothetical protein
MENSITVYQGGAIMPVINIKDALQRYQDQKVFIESILRKDTDYGVIPGTNKPTLLKPGAEKLNWFFGLRPVFMDIDHIEDWSGKDHDGEPFFYYRVQCQLMSHGEIVAAADGSCNSWEKKYRFRDQQRKCPNCGKETIFKSKNDPGFYCWQKKGGCGATFQGGDIRITEQATGQVRNPDISDIVNTILKMAQKRALVAATLIGANASEWFTQDMEDFIDTTFVDVTHTTIPQAATKPATQPVQPAQPEPATVKPWTAENVTWEQAQAEVSSDNPPVPYLTMDIGLLQTRRQSLEKVIKQEYYVRGQQHIPISEEDMTAKINKLNVIDAIIEYRLPF